MKGAVLISSKCNSWNILKKKNVSAHTVATEAVDANLSSIWKNKKVGKMS